MTPGRYIWHTQDSDTPVTVIRTLGKGSDGRTYVQIEGTSTGIPADELTKAPEPRGYSLRDWIRSTLRL